MKMQSEIKTYVNKDKTIEEKRSEAQEARASLTESTILWREAKKSLADAYNLAIHISLLLLGGILLDSWVIAMLPPALYTFWYVDNKIKKKFEVEVGFILKQHDRDKKLIDKLCK